MYVSVSLFNFEPRLLIVAPPSISYFIKEGRVSESGTHDQLLAQRGDYFEYVQLQALSTNE
jgi:ATP-binding cassette subfamily B (MDR/TAP) protein 1